MKTMLQTIHTPKFAEAAKAVAAVNDAPCWHQPVADRRPLGSVIPLAERCAR
jgi:hypothetical protein